MADSVIIHHLNAIPGFCIKTRSGCHYIYSEHGEIELPGHLAEHHIKELTHQSRGHRIGLHPDHQAKLDKAQARADKKAEETPVPVEAKS